MLPVRRIAAVTAGLIGAGAVFGALAGGISVAFCMVITETFTIGSVVGGFVFGSVLGFLLGAITAPVLAWLLLRHVALGRMFVGCALGTTIGAVVGWITATSGVGPYNPLLSAFIGCVVAAIILRHRARRLEA